MTDLQIEHAVIERPSPNCDARIGRAGELAKMLVLHYTGMKTAAQALARLCEPNAKVSAHYTIDEDGTIYQHVPESRRAWHAGVGKWHAFDDINNVSIGIELVNPGHEFGYRPFPSSQISVLELLARDIVRRHKISPRHVVGHSDVAPGRKRDPGELFDWARLARVGVGMWPRPSFRATAVGVALDPASDSGAVIELQAALNTIGYDIIQDGVYGDRTCAVVRAFQRHFWQGSVTGIACPVTLSLIGHISSLLVSKQF